MYWETGTSQDRDGYWVEINTGNGFGPGEKVGPFATEEEAKATELRARLELHRVHGSSQAK